MNSKYNFFILIVFFAFAFSCKSTATSESESKKQDQIVKKDSIDSIPNLIAVTPDPAPESPEVKVESTDPDVVVGVTKKEPTPTEESGDKVRWYTIKEVDSMAKQADWQQKKKKIMIDVYTKWCGPCKWLDKNTFSSSLIAPILNTNFYPIKLDAESTDDILFGSTVYKYVHSNTSRPKGSGRAGYHQLALALVNGNLVYPSVVFIDENMQMIKVNAGYRGPEDFKVLLDYYHENHYQNKSLKQYQTELNQ